jgi:16S rRNA (cytidine1402-2'-O)-methyltransferase
MSKLYVVPTPIGNLEDITLRALRILEEVDLILAEDTRKTGILLRKHNILKKTLPHHKFNEHRFVEQLGQRMLGGEVMALVSEAGTPGISDPGYLLIRECIRKQVVVECLPGPTAFIPALVASGLPCDRFVFEGFLPQKKGRQKRLIALKGESRTIILYESPHRIRKCLHQLMDAFGRDRPACLARELTKIHEEFKRGTLEEILASLGDSDPKGECVILVGGS